MLGKGLRDYSEYIPGARRRGNNTASTGPGIWQGPMKTAALSAVYWEGTRLMYVICNRPNCKAYPCFSVKLPLASPIILRYEPA